MSEGVWIALIAGLTGGTLFPALIEWIKEVVGQKKKYSTLYKQSREVYGILQEAINRTNTDLALLLKTTNGGGPPKMGSPLFITVTHELASLNGVPTLGRYNGMEVGRDYTDMLFQLSSQHFLHLKTEELKSESLLRLSYEAAGTKEAFVYLIKEGKTFWYGSFRTVSSFDEKDIIKLKSIALDARRIFRVNKID